MSVNENQSGIDIEPIDSSTASDCLLVNANSPVTAVDSNSGNDSAAVASPISPISSTDSVHSAVAIDEEKQILQNSNASDSADSAPASQTTAAAAEAIADSSKPIPLINPTHSQSLSLSPSSSELDSLSAHYSSLIHQFRPLIILNSNEKYFPCTPEYYYSQCELYWENMKIADYGYINNGELIGNHIKLEEIKKFAEDHYNGIKKSPYLIHVSNSSTNANDKNTGEKNNKSDDDNTTTPSTSADTETDSFSPSAPPIYRSEPPLSPTDSGQEYNFRCNPLSRHGMNPNELNENCPIYGKLLVNSIENCYEIIYLFFYCFNGSYRVMGKELGAHDGDIEHIRVKIDIQTGKLIKIFYGSHGYLDGYWKLSNEIQYKLDEITGENTTRPIVYVADHSHANYSSSGIYYRICCCANDITSKYNHNNNSNNTTSIIWDPNHSIQLQPPNNPLSPNWINYKYNYCIDGIGAPILQEWWKSGDPNTSNTCCRRTCFSFFNPKCGMKPEFWCLKPEPITNNKNNNNGTTTTTTAAAAANNNNNNNNENKVAEIVIESKNDKEEIKSLE